MKVVIDPGCYMPERAHEDDAGLDLRTPHDVVVPSFGSAVIDTGVHMQIPVGMVGMLKSKSGLNVKSGITSEGVIDAGYTGSIVAKLYNHSGKTKSCGCLNSEQAAERSYKHGGFGSRLYNVWSRMLDRCRNPHNNRFKDYGGRGISVCQEWHDYEAFERWALSSGYDENAKRGDCTLDRIDTNGNYCPENCRWADALTQRHNRREKEPV